MLLHKQGWCLNTLTFYLARVEGVRDSDSVLLTASQLFEYKAH